MKRTIKLIALSTLALSMCIGIAMAFSGNNIKDIKDINKELSKVEIDVYQATQKKAVRAAEIKRLSAEVELINNHIEMRQNESQELTEQKKRLMTGDFTNLQ